MSENCCHRQIVQAALLKHTDGEIYSDCLRVPVHTQICSAKGGETPTVKCSLGKSSLSKLA